jgi:hypothetical protein
MGRVQSCRLVCAGYLRLMRGRTGVAPPGHSVASLAVERSDHRQSSSEYAEKHLPGADVKEALPPAVRGIFLASPEAPGPVAIALPDRRDRAHMEHLAFAGWPCKTVRESLDTSRERRLPAAR